MSKMQSFRGAPGFVDGSSEVDKADKEIPEMIHQARWWIPSTRHPQEPPSRPRIALSPSSTSLSSASFRLVPNAFDRLESLLPDIRVARFSYDYITQCAHVTMVETTVHHQCNRGIGTLLESAVERLSGIVAAFTTAEQHEQNGEVEALQTVFKRLRSVYCDGAAAIVVPNKCYRAPDNQLIDNETKFPFSPFVIEISCSQSFQNAKEKAELYSKISDGHIRTVLVVDINYPSISYIRLHLFATETAPTGDRVLREVQSLTLFDFADTAPVLFCFVCAS
ncbi:hypothetical protein CSOJ01_15209 [Colletotrichum sojae]|uniref:Uncharacterized protein n=1 Tax=Colletotrichum sojae TaxID=2175907 RepID=A0A8H6IN37_9PEZI|nr:hypothetical protein CSOJ01_15209 [Colletotrichum sojae]